jgi:hypothetical protein
MTESAGGEPRVEDERLRILELLEQRRITAAEASDLLAALDDGGRGMQRRMERGRWVRDERGRWFREEMGPPSDRARWFRVRVTDQRTGRVRSNVSVPIGMVGFGLGFARRFRRIPGVEHVDDLFEALRAGRRGMIFDVGGEDGAERVEIFID